MNVQPTFQGEVQLAGWSESHNSGCKVTFWLADPSDLEAFRAMTVRKGNTAGQRLACVLVEIGDDEQPVQAAQEPPKGPAGAERWLCLECKSGTKDHHAPGCSQASKGGALARDAAIICATEDFQRFASLARDGLVDRAKSGPEMAAEYMRKRCRVDSRRELDHSAQAAALFRRLMAEYRDWRERYEVPA